MMGDARDRSLARRAEDVDVVAVRGERGDQPGRRALDAAVEDEGAGDDQEAHCSGGRGAGAIGGCAKPQRVRRARRACVSRPETRSDPAAFRMPPFTPPRGTSRPSACRESLDQWEQHGPGGAEAVSLVAAPAGPGPELARLVRALEQAPDRRREPARVPGATTSPQPSRIPGIIDTDVET